MSECREYPQNAVKNEDLELVSSFKVLVIGQNADFLTSVSCLLYSCSFEVTCVDNFEAALRMLSEKKNEFDLLLIDTHIIDVDVHTFLRQAKNMDLLSVVMTEDVDDTLVFEALKNGALLVLKKPLTIDVVMHLRQHVIKERINKNDNCQNDMICNVATLEESIQDRSPEVKGMIEMIMKQVVGNSHDNNLICISSEEDDDDDDDDSIKKMSLYWTEELHEKFIDAIGQLGQGKCFPKPILELMGVPGLTRMQVARHLQTYRERKWESDENGAKPISTRNSGRMPSLQIDTDDVDTDLTLSLSGWQSEVSQTSTGSPTKNGSSP